MGRVSEVMQGLSSNLGLGLPRAAHKNYDPTDFEISKSQTWPQVHELVKGFQAVPISGDFHNYAKAYSTLVWLYTCIWAISTSLASRPLRIYKGIPGKGKEILEGEVYDLFYAPNPLEGGSELIEMLTMYLELSGNGYWEKYGLIGTYGDGRLPAKLFNLEPGYMTIIPDPQVKVAGYKYDIAGAGGGDEFRPDQITHFKYPNPSNQYYGQGSVQALVTTIVTELYRENFQKMHFQNEARPDVIIKTHTDISKGILPMPQDDGSMVRFAKEWQYAFSGPKNNRLPVMLPPGMDIDLLSEARKDMDFRDLEKSLRERICSGCGVPPALVGIFEYANYANSKEQIKIFWTITMPPKATRISQMITRDILKPYHPEYYCEFDFRNIPALEENAKDLRDGVAKLHGQGLLSFGQAIEALGYEAPDDGELARKRVIASGFVNLDDVVGEIPTDEAGAVMDEGPELEPEKVPDSEAPEDEEGEREDERAEAEEENN